MKNIFFILILLLSGFTAISAQTIAFTNVNVIPMDKERVLKDQTVLVSNGIITAIGKNVKVPKDAQIIDGKGKYLIPGLVDMHTHLLSDGDDYPDSIAEDELRVMVANGVTTIRFMIGTPEQLVLRARSAKGEIIAPTIYSASPHLTGKEQGNDFVVNTEEEAREAVRKSKAAGYDFIKITTFIKAEVYEAAIDEAAKQNIRVVGHADSRFVGLERALKAKQQIEHLDGYLEAILADNAPSKDSVSDLYIYNPKNWESLAYIDEKKIAEVARATVASNPFSDPTQHFMKNTFGLPRSEESIRAQPDFKFYPLKVQEQWLNFYKRNRFINQVSYEKRARWVELRNKIIKAIYDAGGRIMTGSDTPEFLWLYGFTMHRELKALTDAGLSNYAALEAATKNPSMFFGTLEKVGTIEKGKKADLILLNANPLENISATENRAGVMLKGKFYAQDELNKWLDEIAPRIAASHIETPQNETPKPEIFGKDLFTGEVFRGSFAPDGKTFYFFKKIAEGGEEYRIFTSNFADGKWSEPKQLNLGGDFSDLYPSISKDGKRLVFSSYRPAPGDKSEKPNAHIWYADRKDDGWSEPVFLGKANNLGFYHSWVEFGWDGDIYFQQTTPDWKTSKNLITRWNGKEYTEPILFEEVENWKKWNPEVRVVGGSPGTSKEIIFLDVATRNPKTGKGASDIYVSLKKDGKWTEPKPLGANINSDGFDVFPFFSPDNQYLYFVRDFKEFYRIPLKTAIGSIK